MARSSVGRNEEGKPTVKVRSLSAELSHVSLGQKVHEPARAAVDKSLSKIAAFISGAVGLRRSGTGISKPGSVLKRLGIKGYSLTIEHGLSALGVGIAVASSAFASYMILQDHQDRRESGVPANRTTLNWNWTDHFANVPIDPMTTGAIAPTIGTTSVGLSAVGDGAARLDSSAPKLPGYVLRGVFEGVALVEGKDGIRAVRPGFTLPEGNKVMAVERHGGKWVVVTTAGIISDEP